MNTLTTHGMVFAPKSVLLSEVGARGRERLAKRLNGILERKGLSNPELLTNGITSPPPNPTAFRSRIEKAAKTHQVVVFYLGPVIARDGRYFLSTANSIPTRLRSQIDMATLVKSLPDGTCFLAEQILEESQTLIGATKDQVIVHTCKRNFGDSSADTTIIEVFLDAISYMPRISINNIIDIWRFKHSLRTCESDLTQLTRSEFVSTANKPSDVRTIDYNLLSSNPGSREDGINELQFFRADLTTADEATFTNVFFAACDSDVNVRCAAERMLRSPRVSRARVMIPNRYRLPPDFLEQFCLIPASDFTMGSSKESDPHSLPEERPQHSLFMHDFHIARTPVTFGDWVWFKKDTTPGFSEDIGVRRKQPKTHISWYDALDYCAWLTLAARRQGFISKEYEVTLPSEAEWEKSARGRDGRLYPWGNTFERSCANYRDSGNLRPLDVGTHRYSCCSPYGVADMAGNVWEWTRSLWGRNGASPEYGYPYDANDGRENLNAPGDIRRVVRGGSWYYFDYCLRCSTRNLMYPYVVHSGGGFRTVIRSLSSQ